MQVLSDPLTKLPPHLFIVAYKFSHELLPILFLQYMNSYITATQSKEYQKAT
jgi:hypothetical protein